MEIDSPEKNIPHDTSKPAHRGLPNNVRVGYTVLILVLLIACGVSLWRYKKANDEYNAEKIGLQKIWDEHNAKINNANRK